MIFPSLTRSLQRFEILFQNRLHARGLQTAAPLNCLESCAHQAFVANVSGGSCSTWKAVPIDRGDVEQKAPTARHIKNEFSLGFKGLRCRGRERWELVTLLVCLKSPSSSSSQLIHPSAFKPTEVSDCLKAWPPTLSRGLTIQYWLLPKIITLHWW